MKMWNGRFAKEENPAANAFNSSTSFDGRMWKQDILGSIAHAKMLGKQGIITEEESACLVTHLKEIYWDMEAGRLDFEPEDEDIHMFVERILTHRIGETGKKLHTARSRNDQVALDFRMYQKELIENIDKALYSLLEVLYRLACGHQDTVLPGFTHMQKAQPVLLAQHLPVSYTHLRAHET